MSPTVAKGSILYSEHAWLTYSYSSCCLRTTVHRTPRSEARCVIQPKCASSATIDCLLARQQDLCPHDLERFLLRCPIPS
mmetsp:Transcript_75009/g.121894  ORF Transcript_75009/g.121894 Transcript_75009/m.121894 type:complete len:80 (-) Transcript_75009:65-304(-)